jgi:HEAT repeat protein
MFGSFLRAGFAGSKFNLPLFYRHCACSIASEECCAQKRKSAMKNQLLAATIPLLACGLLAGSRAQAASSTETALGHIDKALHARNPDIRREAVRALSLIASKEPYQQRLEAMLNDKDVPVRLAVVVSLANVNDAKALRVALDDRTPEVRFAAAKALFDIDDPAARKALLRILHGDAKTSSSFLTREERDGLRLLQTPKPMMMTAVRQSGGLVPVPGAAIGVATALKALATSGGSDRATVALLLGEKKDAEVVAALHQALADKDAAVRGAAIQAIALQDDPAMARDAEPMFNDKNLTVRLRAAACYLRLSEMVGARPQGTEIRSWQE